MVWLLLAVMVVIDNLQNHVVVAIATITIVASTVTSNVSSIVAVTTTIVALMTISQPPPLDALVEVWRQG
jgi:hypothetical protein